MPGFRLELRSPVRVGEAYEQPASPHIDAVKGADEGHGLLISELWKKQHSSDSALFGVRAVGECEVLVKDSGGIPFGLPAWVMGDLAPTISLPHLDPVT